MTKRKREREREIEREIYVDDDAADVVDDEVGRVARHVAEELLVVFVPLDGVEALVLHVDVADQRRRAAGLDQRRHGHLHQPDGPDATGTCSPHDEIKIDSDASLGYVIIFYDPTGNRNNRISESFFVAAFQWRMTWTISMENGFSWVLLG